MLSVATAPGATLAFVAFHVGTADPAKTTLPMCLFLITVSSWGGSSVARAMLARDAAGQSGHPGDKPLGQPGVAPRLSFVVTVAAVALRWGNVGRPYPHALFTR